MCFPTDVDFLDFKPITTRKLRRRLNPDGNGGGNSGTQEKRRKQSPTINILLDEASINEDLKLINKVSGKPFTSRKPVQTASHDDHISPNDARIEDGKLYFEKRWSATFSIVFFAFHSSFFLLTSSLLTLSPVTFSQDFTISLPPSPPSLPPPPSPPLSQRRIQGGSR